MVSIGISIECVPHSGSARIVYSSVRISGIEKVIDGFNALHCLNVTYVVDSRMDN